MGGRVAFACNGYIQYSDLAPEQCADSGPPGSGE